MFLFCSNWTRGISCSTGKKGSPMPDQSPGLGPMNEDAGAQPPGRHLFGSLALAWISGGAIVLFAVAISGRLDATGALGPWLWSSPWSLACLALAGTIG